jgi:hypothetical protein
MKNLFLLSCLFLISSCIKIKDNLIKEGAKNIFVHSILNPDSNIVAIIGITNSVFDKNINFINNSKVLLFENGILRDTLQNISQGKYVSAVQILPNNSYKFMIDDTIVSSTYIPNIANLEYAQINYPTGYDAGNQEYFGSLTFAIKDNPTIENFYEVVIYTIDTNYFNNTYSYSFFNNYNNILIPDEIVKNEGDWDFKPTSVFFSDELFNGEFKDFNFQITTPYETLNGSQQESLLSKKGFIQLRSISKQYYLYRKYYTRHAYNSTINDDNIQNMLFIGEPLDMYSNVTKGLGVVASYSSTIKKIVKK